MRYALRTAGLELRDDAEPTSRAEFGAVVVVAVGVGRRIITDSIGDITHDFNRWQGSPFYAQTVPADGVGIGR